MNILHINISSFTQIHGTMNDKYIANIHIHPPGHFPVNLMPHVPEVFAVHINSYFYRVLSNCTQSVNVSPCTQKHEPH